MGLDASDLLYLTPAAPIKGFMDVQNNGGIANTLGVQNNFQASMPYQQNVLQQDVNQQAQIYGGQQSLAQALMAQMNGQGPNPAQTQFMQNQQSNIANAQGMIASQRGLNPALAARMGANAAAQANQQASMGSAIMQQQQQLAATSNLGNLYGQMQQGNIGYQNQYNNAFANAQGLNQKTQEGNTGRNAQLIGGLMNSGGGIAAAAAGAATGGMIMGQANVPGDSKQNDTVDAKLSPGEIVIPRSKAHDPEKAKEFIDHLLKAKEKKGGYGEVVAARRKKKAA